MKTSLRLQTIAALVPNGARACDVGTDHAFLAIALRQNGKAEKVIAADIKEKPLENARKNIEASGVTGVEIRLCNGLSGIHRGEVDTIIIAGIGGEVIAGILSDCLWLSLAPAPLLILQPTTSPEILRRYLSENGFSLLKEIPIEENGKVYSIFSCRFFEKGGKKDDAFYYTGLVTPETPAGRQYIQKQYKRLLTCKEALKKIPEKQKEYRYYSRICEQLEKQLTENYHAI